MQKQSVNVMNEHLETQTALRLARTAENLKKNNMEAIIVKDRAEALNALRTYLFDGCTIAVGGSVTLEEIGALTLFRSGKYHFLDRYAPGLTDSDRKEIFRASFSADVFAMSANAVTETGLLYNVDGRSNRTAPLLYGPDTVVVVAGINKLVPDIDAAVERVKYTAAPANAIRLHTGTPCTLTGVCASVSAGKAEDICAGCQAERRICSNFVISAHQTVRDRIKVILCREALGY